MVKAHRFAYERSYGPIPANRDIDHLCGNRPCVNALHLEAVAHAENVRRGRLGQVKRLEARLRQRTQTGQFCRVRIEVVK